MEGPTLILRAGNHLELSGRMGLVVSISGDGRSARIQFKEGIETLTLREIPRKSLGELRAKYKVMRSNGKPE